MEYEKVKESRQEAEAFDLLRDDSSSDDDDFFLHGPTRPSIGVAGDNKIASLRDQVSNVTKVMWSNVEKVVDRGGRLDDLEARSQNLQEATVQFQSSSDRVLRKAWWQNRKMNVVIGSVVTVIILIIIIASV